MYYVQIDVTFISEFVNIGSTHNSRARVDFSSVYMLDHEESFFKLFILAALGLRCCAWFLSRCSERGLLSSCSVRTSHCGGFSCCGARALGVRASVIAARGLQSCGLWALECVGSAGCDARALLL